jgi:hypothetical protein
MARRSPARIDLAISAARAVERLVCHAEAFETKRKHDENFRTAYSCAAVLYSEIMPSKVGTLFDAVSAAIKEYNAETNSPAQTPTKEAFSKWFGRWAYRLKAE